MVLGGCAVWGCMWPRVGVVVGAAAVAVGRSLFVEFGEMVVWAVYNVLQGSVDERMCVCVCVCVCVRACV
jgi:ABC-type uncharacterized transport system permease subunit